jgi:hypothetical protein
MKVNSSHIANIEYLKKLSTRKVQEEKPKNGSSVSGKYKDTLEISKDAQKLLSSEVKTTDLAAVREKIANKFYDSDAVLGAVADKIMKDLE